MAGLQIKLFGGFQIQDRDHAPLRFPTQKVRALVAYLSVEAQSAHPREKLMALFWPEQNQTSASNNLRQTLARLRSALPANTLLLQDNEIRFQPAYDYHLDVAHFLHLIAATTRHRQQGPFDNEAQIALLVEATSLYRGDFLAHFGLPDSPAFEEWALLKREWLRGEAMKLLDQLTLIYEQTSRHEEAVATARRQLVIDSLHETAYQQLMRNLALAGRRSEALEQFDLCQRLLAQELAVEPALATTQLAQQIRTGALTANGNLASSPAISIATLTTPHFTVPAALTPLVGREAEVAELAGLLHDPGIRLLTILGPGGMGKTHLLLEATQQLCQSSTPQHDAYFPDGVWWVALAAVPTPERMVEALAAAFTLKLNNYQEPAQQLHQWLRPKKLLLLLDNMEHLTDGVDLLVDLLRMAPHLKIVTTSRARLQLQGEQLLPLDGLSYPHDLISAHGYLPLGASPDWARYAAIQLFMQQAQRTQPGFACQGDEAQAIATICRTLQGMPLAILLAAGWVTTLPVAALAEQLQSSLDFLAHEWHDLPPRQQSMRAVLDHSWRLLSEHEQQILAGASLFWGGFTEDAAENILQATRRDLTALVGKSMVQRVSNGRYTMHELVRQYAAEKLAQRADQGVSIRKNFTRYFVELSAQYQNLWGEHSVSSEQLNLLLTDIENLRIAWRHVLQDSNYEWFERIRPAYTYLLFEFDSNRNRLEAQHQSIDFLERIISSQPRFYPAQQTLAWGLNGLGTFLMDMGNQEEAQELFQRSIRLFQGPAFDQDESRLNCAMAWCDQARVLFHSQPIYAKQIFEQSLSIFQQYGHPQRAMDTLFIMTHVDYHLGDYPKAEQLFRECLNYFQQKGELFSLGIKLMIGITCARLGRFQEANHLLYEEVHTSEMHNALQNLANSLPHRSMILFWSGNEIDAQLILRTKYPHYIHVTVPIQTAEAQRTQATIYLHAGDYAQAAHCSLQAIETQRFVRDSFALGESLVILGQIRLGEERWADAEAALTECITLYQSLGEHGVIGSAYATLAYLRLHQGNAAEARQQVRNALQIAHEWRAFFAAIYALPALALLKLAAGEAGQAYELYALVAAQTPAVARSQWFAQMAGRKLTARQTTLSSALVASTQKKGETADLWAAVKQLHDELQAALSN